MAFKRIFMIMNVIMILIGILLIVNAKAAVTGAVVGALGLAAERATFIGLVLFFMGILLFIIEGRNK